jgi:hypothetical protein
MMLWRQTHLTHSSQDATAIVDLENGQDQSYDRANRKSQLIKVIEEMDLTMIGTRQKLKVSTTQ